MADTSYWDPLPTVATSAHLLVANYEDGCQLGAASAYLRGSWESRDWRNIPGPFYGAQTDSCWTGRLIAPRHVVYEDDYGSEVVFRQPRTQRCGAGGVCGLPCGWGRGYLREYGFWVDNRRAATGGDVLPDLA